MSLFTRGCFCVLLMLPAMAFGQASSQQPAFTRGLPDRPDYFPIAVWLQSPANAPRYKTLGINLYIGLWNGPTEDQLAALEKAGMPVVCAQNSFALKNLDRKIIVAWMHGDEPDNAQSLPGGKGYGPPILPARIVEDYQKIRNADPSRPVILNLGQGVAWDGWHGRGTRTNKPEDYPQYAKGADIVSFDIYPATHDKPAVAGKLWYVPRGVDRLRQWTNDQKPVWSCIECTRISNPNVKPTPAQVRSEVWMALIRGAKGLIYFSHEFKPKFIEAGMLADGEMAKAIGAVNQQIQALAPALNSPTLKNAVTVTTDSPAAPASGLAPIDVMAKQAQGKLYIFAASTTGAAGQAKFTVSGKSGPGKVQVIGEDRQIDMADGVFADSFPVYGVHLYSIPQ